MMMGGVSFEVHRQKLADARLDAIEQCAQVAEVWASVSSNSHNSDLLLALADAIRTKKNKHA